VLDFSNFWEAAAGCRGKNPSAAEREEGLVFLAEKTWFRSRLHSGYLVSLSSFSRGDTDRRIPRTC